MVEVIPSKGRCVKAVDIEKATGQSKMMGQSHIHCGIVPTWVDFVLPGGKGFRQQSMDFILGMQLSLVPQHPNRGGGECLGNGIRVLTGICRGNAFRERIAVSLCSAVVFAPAGR